jgi:hypothetical protein
MQHLHASIVGIGFHEIIEMMIKRFIKTNKYSRGLNFTLCLWNNLKAEIKIFPNKKNLSFNMLKSSTFCFSYDICRDTSSENKLSSL